MTGKVYSTIRGFACERLFNIDFWIARRYLAATLVFFVLVLGRFHGLSIGEWDKVLIEKTDSYEQVNIIGKPRAIRSDEYFLATPWYLAQSMSGDYYPLINRNIRSDGQNMMVVSYAPVFDISLIGKPANWGFFLLGKEYGFSWWWFSRLFFLLLSSFELAMILSCGNRAFSGICALWLAFSPAVQWWFSSIIIDLLYYAQFMIVAAHGYITAPVKRTRAYLSVALVLCSVGFILSSYPRYQVPMAYLVALFIACFLYVNKTRLQFGKTEVLQAVFGALFVVGVVGSVYIRSSDAISLLSSTIYPGKQFFTGGGGNFFNSFWYLSNMLLPYKNINLPNNCLASTFFNFMPAVFPVIVMIVCGRYKVGDSRKTLLLALFSYFLFQVSWELVSYPAWFAKYSLFSYIKTKPPARLFSLSTNLIGVYISIVVFSLISEKPPMAKRGALAISLLVSALYYAAIQNTWMKQYLKGVPILVVLSFFLVLNFFYLGGVKKYFYSLLTLLIVISGLTVNPLARGLSPIYDKAVSREILNIRDKYPDAKWGFVGGMFRANLFPALGVKSFNGYHLYPDMKMWNLLDPKGLYSDKYNRFYDAILQFTEQKTYFTIPPDTVDVLNIFLSWSDLDKTGIKFLLSREPLVNSGYLKELRFFEKDDMHLYEVIARSGVPLRR